MKNDPLLQFITLRKSLLKERGAILARLAQIDEVLTPPAVAAPAPVATPAPEPAPKATAAPQPQKRTRRGQGGRRRGQPSLRDAIRALTAEKPMSKVQIADALLKAGRTFTQGTLDVVLYTKGNFKRADGLFSPPE